MNSLKREVLSSPKSSANHERSAQHVLADAKNGRGNARKSPLRMS